ncbi:MAG: isochorismate synthase [Actinomycetota bacterium]|nr:isochorismate synthase [Actinomycetota bacterium]
MQSESAPSIWNSTDTPALLCDAAGRPLDSTTLELTEFPLGPGEVELLRTAARRSGRVLEREHLALLGLGTAARLILPFGTRTAHAAATAAALLSTLGGAGRAYALTALPFDPEAAGTLVIPEVLAIVEDDAATALVATAAGHAHERLDTALLEGSVAEPDADLPDRFALASAKSHAEFRALVADAVAAVTDGELDKVVLAREVTVTANRPFQQADLIARLRALHPSCLAFALDGFLGASPELLCRRTGGHVFSEPLAGTVARSGDPEADRQRADALFSSPKERREHGLVVEAITAELARHDFDVSVPEVPELLELRNVAHLATPITGSTSSASPPSALELACALHPTPAVGGSPKARALEYLAKHEGLERQRYAGPVGYLQSNGDGEFWIGIRSAEIDGNRARLMAGVGIVAGSDPLAELAETQLKLQALLAVAVRP